MSFLASSGPKSQLIAWTGVAGAGLAFYIYTKEKTRAKRKRDLELKQSGQFPGKDADARPTRRRGGVGISDASTRYPPASSSAPPKTPDSAFLQQPSSLRPRSFHDVPPALLPVTLAQYRASRRMAENALDQINARTSSSTASASVSASASSSATSPASM